MPDESLLNFFSEPAQLADSVDYQQGSVVSKALIQKQQGSLTVFAFAAGQGLSEHSAPYDAFVTVLDGEGELTTAGRAHSVQAGQSLWFPRGVPHAVKAVKPFKMLLVMIRG